MIKYQQKTIEKRRKDEYSNRILGYGNLGRGVECAIKQNEDMELVAVFTRRDHQQ